MIEDFDNFEDGACVTGHFCIVGAGAAGITIAREFLGTHYKITVLESGGLDGDTETQKLYQSELVGLPHTGNASGRQKSGMRKLLHIESQSDCIVRSDTFTYNLGNYSLLLTF